MSHIAQLNIGRLRHPTNDPRTAAFMTNLDRINALAERSERFVWRLKDDSNNATAIRPAAARPWRSTCRCGRASNRKGEWFEKLGAPHFVMWTISAGHIPDLEERWS